MKEYCNNCALRLFNKNYNIKGVGNPFAGTLIIVPNVNYLAMKKNNFDYDKQVEEIKSIILSTGGLEHNFYILPLIRCHIKDECPINNNIIKNCFNYLRDDFIKYDFKDILLLGDAARMFFGIDGIKDQLNTMIISNNDRRYFINYSPFVKFTNSNLYEDFKNNLIRWYNCVVNGYNTNVYKVLRI